MESDLVKVIQKTLQLIDHLASEVDQLTHQNGRLHSDVRQQQMAISEELEKSLKQYRYDQMGRDL